MQKVCGVRICATPGNCDLWGQVRVLSLLFKVLPQSAWGDQLPSERSGWVDLFRCYGMS